MPETIEFFNQWQNRPEMVAQEFKEPTCTVPDQSMTIQEIIAKFTRTGLVPQSFVHKDDGGNEAFPPDFDPLDEAGDYMAEAKAAAAGSSKEPEAAPSGEPDNQPASAAKGEGV